jgi:hypothetical protein
LAKLAASLAPPESNSIFKAFSDAGMIKKLTLSSRLDISPSMISLYNMDAVAEDKMKASGVINVDRTVQRPNFVAKLNFFGWDASSFPAGSYDSFLQKIAKSDADMELAFQNLTKSGLKISGLTFKGKVNERGFDMDVSGNLSDRENFTLNGHAASLAPVSGLDVTYTVKAEQAREIARALDIALPPPLRSWKGADIKGEIKGSAPKYAFTTEGKIDGCDMALNGSADNNFYQLALHLKHKNAGYALGLLGLPIDRLVDDAGDFEFSGEVKGSADHYRIEKIQAQLGTSALSGSLERKGDKYTADLVTDKLDMDRWLAGDWPVKQDITLTLQGDTLVWQGQDITNPQMTLEADASSVKTSGLQGVLWGGTLNADLALTRGENGTWSSIFKGSLKRADLNPLIARLGFHGFSTGVSDLDFDLTSADNTPAAAAGQIGVKASSLRIAAFNFDKLGDTASQLTAVPPNLQQLVDAALLNNGPEVFKDIQAQVKADHGKLSFDSLKVSNAYGDMNVSGSANVKAGSYTVDADLLLRQHYGFPRLKVQRSSGDASYSVDSAPIGKYIVDNNPVVQPEVAPVPAAAVALPPSQNEDNGAIKGILKRLDEEDGKKTP